jgi:ribosome-associated heat shock protein Hsp15
MLVRADSYLWAIRMYKTRSLAAQAIKGGKAKLHRANFKASHHVKAGDIYHLKIGDEEKIIEAVTVIDKRVSFQSAQQHYIDHSPKSEKTANSKRIDGMGTFRREKGSGRPTKRDRRKMDGLQWDD